MDIRTLTFNSTDIVLNKGEDYYNLQIFNGVPKEQFALTYVSILRDDGTISVHGANDIQLIKNFTYQFNDQGEFRLFRFNCGGCDIGYDIYMNIEIKYRGNIYPIKVTYKD